MPTLCASPIKARVARIVQLTECGVIVTGAGAQVVTDGFIQIAPSPEYEEGEEHLVLNANGSPCVNEKDPNFLKRVGLSIDFCKMDPDAVVLMTGERLLATGSPVTGTGVAFGEGLLTARFSLEVWQPLAGAGACSATGVTYYMYWAFPNVGNAMIGDFTMENAPLTFSIEADTKAASATWGNGPGSIDWLNGNTIAADEHFAFNITTVPPPTPTCGAFAL
jgi:hypothetical protein